MRVLFFCQYHLSSWRRQACASTGGSPKSLARTFESQDIFERGSYFVDVGKLQLHDTSNMPLESETKDGLRLIHLPLSPHPTQPLQERGSNATQHQPGGIKRLGEVAASIAACAGSVTAIFSPRVQGPDKCWLPFQDAESGKRLPAQSRGGVVIKLAGEMGQNGAHFVSHDGGETFLDTYGGASSDASSDSSEEDGAQA